MHDLKICIMTKKLLFKILLLSISIFSYSQNTVGTISITEEAYDAYTLVSINTKAYLIDNCGQVINEWTSQYLPGSAIYLLPNGNILRAGKLEDGSSNIGFGGQGGIVEMFDWDGNIIWSYTHSSNEFRQHHDIYPLPNGNILILAATVINQADAVQEGRDPNKLLDSELYNQRIFEVEPVGLTGGNVVWEWNVIDHVIQDIDPTKNNFGNVGENPQKIDINFLNGFGAANNWLHVNAIQYNEERDQIIISSRRLSEFWIIDHSTTTIEASGIAGDILYRWGNPQSYRQGTESDKKLFGQHTPYYIPSGYPNEGKIMLYNNGFLRSPQYSQVLIIDPPTNINGDYQYTPNTAYGPASPDFTYPETAPTTDSDFYSSIVSNAQQLPNGNILICQGRQGFYFEINENNQIVWEYQMPISNGNGTSYVQGEPAPINGITFRAIKYGLDYPAFTGRDLTPGLPLETNPNITACLNVLSNDDFNLDYISFFPNPTKDFVTINTQQSIDKIEVFNITGIKVLDFKNTKTINLKSFESGIYFLKFKSGNNVITKKIIKQ